jgi:hypothetical protein
MSRADNAQPGVDFRDGDFPFLIRANFQKAADPLGTDGGPLRGPGGAHPGSGR